MDCLEISVQPEYNPTAEFIGFFFQTYTSWWPLAIIAFAAVLILISKIKTEIKSPSNNKKLILYCILVSMFIVYLVPAFILILLLIYSIEKSLGSSVLLYLLLSLVFILAFCVFEYKYSLRHRKLKAVHAYKNAVIVCIVIILTTSLFTIFTYQEEKAIEARSSDKCTDIYDYMVE